MSNLVSYLPMGKRLGETIVLPYAGNIITSAVDGSVWKINNEVPVTYDSSYAALLTEAPGLLQTGSLLNGPLSGGYWSLGGQAVANGYGYICGTSAGTLVALSAYTGNTFGDIYYTSTNGGTSWTARTMPASTKQWFIFFDGTNFIAIANSTTTNGIYESTDAITWTARNSAISMQVAEVLYKNSLYVIAGNASSNLQTSTDRITWTSRTITTLGNVASPGLISYNAGAGLWIASTSTGGQYQTSPDAITWTNRTSWPTNHPFRNASAIAFASNSTTTIAVDGTGAVCSSTDGINWTDRGRVWDVTAIGAVTASTVRAIWDGTNFIVLLANITLAFYSSDGVTWNRCTRLHQNLLGRVYPFSGGDSKVLIWCRNRMIVSSDITSTTPNFIFGLMISADFGSFTASQFGYTRIK